MKLHYYTSAILLASSLVAVAIPPQEVTVPVFSKTMRLHLSGSAPIYKEPDEKSPVLQWARMSDGIDMYYMYHWAGESPKDAVGTGYQKIDRAGDYPLIATDGGMWYKTYNSDREGWLHISGDVNSREPVGITLSGDASFTVDPPYSKNSANVFVRRSGKYEGYSAFVYEYGGFSGICVGVIIDGVGVYPILLPCRVKYSQSGPSLQKPAAGSIFWELSLPSYDLNRIPDDIFGRIIDNARSSDDIFIVYKLGSSTQMYGFNAARSSGDLETVTVPFRPGTGVLPVGKVKTVESPESKRIAELKKLERTVVRPAVRRVNSGVTVESVSLSTSVTAITLSFTKTGRGPWNVNCDAVIKSNVSGDKEYRIKRVSGAEMSPRPTYSREGEKVTFTMYFSPVPADATSITLIEGPSPDNFHAYDISVPLTAVKGQDEAPSEVYVGEICRDVDVAPEYPGGLNGLMKDLGGHIKYPDRAYNEKIKGRVMVSAVVETDGSLTNHRIVKSVHPDLDAEALRVVKLLKKMTPAMKDGKAVRCEYVIVVPFNAVF